jgi:hypothetical protein
MHSYAIDSSERKNISFYLAAISLVLTLFLKNLFGKWNFEPSAYTYIPSAFAIYGILFIVFDKWFWKCIWLRDIGIVKIPCISGEWEGELRSSHSNLKKPHSIELKIHQNWTTIRITLESKTSFSSSEMASIHSLSDSQFELRWEYHAESKIPISNQFEHRGVTMLRFEIFKGKTKPEMRGTYYTQHGRDTNGTIFVQKQT